MFPFQKVFKRQALRRFLAPFTMALMLLGMFVFTTIAN